MNPSDNGNNGDNRYNRNNHPSQNTINGKHSGDQRAAIPAPTTHNGQKPVLITANAKTPGLTPAVSTNGAQVHGRDEVYRVQSPAAPPPPVGDALAGRDSAARDRMRRRRVSGSGRRAGGEWAWVIIAMAMIGVAVSISLVLFLVLRSARSTQEIMPTAAVAVSALPTPVDFRASVAGNGASLTLSDGSNVILQPWDGESRLTVLLMGLDRRPGDPGLAYRTDTMLILSMEPGTGEVGMLSIPRDTYVEVPGYVGRRRINEAMVLGELNRIGYGPVLAKETVQKAFGIRVNHYIVVDFNAFVEIVDAIGGVEIDLDYNIYDPRYPSMNYGYEPFSLSAGHHLLDGMTALKFARTRHGDNDIKRGERQQQVIFAIMDKASDPANLPRILSQSPAIWNAVRENFYTDLAFEQMISLGLYVKDIPREQIVNRTLGFEYLSPFTTAEGASVLIPNQTRIGTLMSEVFGENYSQ